MYLGEPLTPYLVFRGGMKKPPQGRGGAAEDAFWGKLLKNGAGRPKGSGGPARGYRNCFICSTLSCSVEISRWARALTLWSSPA